MRVALPTVVLAAVAWTQILGTAAAQDPQPGQRLTFRGGVERVTLSATVRTKQGRPVTDLKAEDFELLDNGERRSIVEFRSEPSPVRLAMLMDVSGSMDVAAKRAAAQEAAWHLLSWLTAGRDEVALYAFDRQIVELQPPAPSPGQVLEKLDSLKPYGETSLFDAIAATGRAVAAHGAGRRAVVVLTDGADNASKLTASEVSGIASAIDVPVYIVVIVSPFDRASPETTMDQDGLDALMKGRLGDLARWTGGEIFTSFGTAQASRAARQIVTELRHQYLLAFAPGAQQGWHPIALNTRNKDLIVRTRSGYVVDRRSGTE
jgi:Ca-activated chloride channel family protein